MLGKNHLLAAVLLAGANALVLFDKGALGWREALVFLTGVVAGSLLPDVDADDARVFHGSGIRALRRLDPFLSAAGRLTQAVVYFPLRLLFGAEHRGVMHSLAGAAVSGVLWAAVAWFLQTALAWNPVVYFVPAGVFAGCILHLAGDSFTRSGVAWFAPFSSRRVCGQAATGRTSEYFVVAGFVAAAALTYWMGRTLSVQAVVFLPVLSAGLVLALFFSVTPVLWFMRFLPGFS